MKSPPLSAAEPRARLPMLIENRPAGINPMTGQMTYRAYHVGHGQQLARRRAEARREEQNPPVPAKKSRAKKVAV